MKENIQTLEYENISKKYKVNIEKKEALEKVLKRRSISFSVGDTFGDIVVFTIFNCSNTKFKQALIRATCEALDEKSDLKIPHLAPSELKCKEKIFRELKVSFVPNSCTYLLPAGVVLD